MVVCEDRIVPAYNPKHGWLSMVYNLVTTRTKYTKNEIRVYEDGVCEIDVYDKFGMYKETGVFSEVDLEQVIKYKWYKDSTGYLSTTINKNHIRLHRLLFPNNLTDHYDNDKMNNTRENLQQISHSINIAKIKNKMLNSSGVTGVYFTPSKTWQSTIEINGKKKTKNYKTKEDAVLQRYIWELNAWGKNAPQLDIIEKEFPRLVSAVQNGYAISDNVKLVKIILNKLDKDEHCPCSIKKIEDTKCPCANFRQMLKEGRVGETCHCGLYQIVEIPVEK